MAAPTVQEIVRGKLPYLTDLDNPAIALNEYDAMVIMQKCFGKEDIDIDVAMEVNYSPLQRSLLGDLVSIAMLLKKVVENSSKSGSSGSTSGTYIKKVKAGSVESEFGLLNSGSDSINTLGLDTDALLKELKESAFAKAGLLGCTLSWLVETEQVQEFPVPFLTGYYPDSNCGCLGF